MERPERPTRHKSHPVKVRDGAFPFRPSFSSDSESDMNENDVPTQITYYRQPETSAGGASTSSTAHQPKPSSETSIGINPIIASISPVPSSSREEEPSRVGMEIMNNIKEVRRKRSAASSAAASVIFDSVDTLIGPTTTNQERESPDRTTDRFQHTDFVIRPRSFCRNSFSDCSNVIRPPAYKIKRSHMPIDLTPGTSRDESSHASMSTTLRESLLDMPMRESLLPSSSELQSSYSRPFPEPPPRSDPSRSEYSSSILRHFDEICSDSPLTRFQARRKAHRVSLRNSMDDYCELVGNFLFNFPPTSPTTSSTQRITPVSGERSEVAAGSSTAELLNRHVLSSAPGPDLPLPDPDPFLLDHPHTPPQPSHRHTAHHIQGGEPMDQSADDVIVLETPERPPLPGSPDPFVVPSSRSPSPTITTTPTTAPTSPPTLPPHTNPALSSSKPHGGSGSSGDVPMTLQELNQTLVSLLECPVCLDHATPPIYQCCKGHILCQQCHPRLTTCPICRSRLPGDRNSAMEKVAEKLMYPCKNTVTGCTMMLKLDDKQRHEEGCGFRHYACIISACHWKGYKPELVVHLQSHHPDKLITGATKELHVPIAVPVGGSVLTWVQSAHNEVFNVIFHVDLYKRIMKGCVTYIGSPEKASKFSYQFELKQRNYPFCKLTYSRATHADTLKPGQPLCHTNDFSINIDMARLYRPPDCDAHTIPVHITILQNDCN